MTAPRATAVGMHQINNTLESMGVAPAPKTGELVRRSPRGLSKVVGESKAARRMRRRGQMSARRPLVTVFVER